MAGCRSGMEAEILKEGLTTTREIGFLAHGEMSFTQLIQEPCFHTFSCWGMTLGSQTATTKPKEKRVRNQKLDQRTSRKIKSAHAEESAR